MQMTGRQWSLIASASVFFALQFLPRYFVSLDHAELEVCYKLLAVTLGLTIAVGTTFALAMWMSTSVTNVKQNRRNWFITFSLMLTSACVLSFGATSSGSGLPSGSFSRKFDRQRWGVPSSSDYVAGAITVRQKMLGDVIQRIVVDGTRNDVIAALGPSENFGFFMSAGCDLIYRTGPERDSLFAIDDEWLLIWFDANDRASRYEVWSD